MNNTNLPQVSTASAGWAAGFSNTSHLRLYSCNQQTIQEHCFDGKTWQVGSFSLPGQHVSVTQYNEGDIHVYGTKDGKVTEWVYHSGWEQGHFTFDILVGKVKAVSTAAVSWSQHGKSHLRAYVCDGTTVTELCNDGAEWTAGGFGKRGQIVSATEFKHGHIRVYCTNDGKTTEWGYDSGNGWTQGTHEFEKAAGITKPTVSTAAISWTNGNTVHLRLFTSDGETVREHCYDGKGWNMSTFSKPGQHVSATIDVSERMNVFCTTDGVTTQWNYDPNRGSWQQHSFGVR